MKKCLVHIFLLLPFLSFAQSNPSDSSRSSHGRKWLIGLGTALGYGGSFVGLNEAWYKGYARSSFHTFNDVGEWLQMDKLGHAWTAYTTSRITSSLWRWAGSSREQSVLLGTGSSLLYMLSIEYLDGRSLAWGWSWPDAGADVFGAFLFAGQEWGWKDQRILLKFSSRRRHYPGSLEQRAGELFGSSLSERILKDYNAQKYWLSVNLRSLTEARLPSWLNLALGYGADGMFGGYENFARDKYGNISFDRRDIKRVRQWYLAPDIDLSRIKTKSKVLHSFFTTFNLKVPAPTLEYSNSRFKWKWVDL